MATNKIIVTQENLDQVYEFCKKFFRSDSYFKTDSCTNGHWKVALHKRSIDSLLFKPKVEVRTIEKLPYIAIESLEGSMARYIVPGDEIQFKKRLICIKSKLSSKPEEYLYQFFRIAHLTDKEIEEAENLYFALTNMESVNAVVV